MTEIISNAEGKAADIQRTLLDFYGVLIKTVGREAKNTFFPEKEKKSLSLNQTEEEDKPQREISDVSVRQISSNRVDNLDRETIQALKELIRKQGNELTFPDSKEELIEGKYINYKNYRIVVESQENETEVFIIRDANLNYYTIFQQEAEKIVQNRLEIEDIKNLKLFVKSSQQEDFPLPPETEEEERSQMSRSPLPPNMTENLDKVELSQEEEEIDFFLDETEEEERPQMSRPFSEEEENHRKIEFHIYQEAKLVYKKKLDDPLPEIDFLSEKQANQLELLKLIPEGAVVEEFVNYKINCKITTDNQIQETTVFETDGNGLIIKNMNASSTLSIPDLEKKQDQQPQSGSEILKSRSKNPEKSEVISNLLNLLNLLEDISLIINITENIKRSIDFTPEDEIAEQENVTSVAANNRLIKDKAEEIKGYIKFYIDQELKFQENQVISYIKERKDNPRKPNFIANLVNKFTQNITNIVETVSDVIEQKIDETDLTYKLRFLFNSKDESSPTYVFSNQLKQHFIYRDTQGNLQLQDDSGIPLDLNYLDTDKRKNILKIIEQELALVQKKQKSKQVPNSVDSVRLYPSHRKTR